MLDGEHSARATHPRLNLIADQQDAVLVAYRPEHRQKLAARHAVAPFPLDGLDENRRNFVGRCNGAEQFFQLFARTIVMGSMNA